jgi:uncharacterized protein YdeI (YjbR/CyaY-like superfamily)
MATKKATGDMAHKLPADFRSAIESDAAAKCLWVTITPLARNEWICWVTSAKKEETRTIPRESVTCCIQKRANPP